MVLATSIIFITHGAKFHKFLICAVGMTIGTFGGLFLTEQFGITEFKPKWGVSLALGLALWIAVMFVEQLMFSAVAMGIGGGGMMIIYSFVGHYIPPQPEYYMFVAIGIGCVAGYFLTDMVKKAALTLIYSVLGGVLLGSAVFLHLLEVPHGPRRPLDREHHLQRRHPRPHPVAGARVHRHHGGWRAVRHLVPEQECEEG